MIDPEQFNHIVRVLPILEHADQGLLCEFQQKAFFSRIPEGKDMFVEGD